MLLYLEEKQHYVDGKRQCEGNQLEGVEVAGKYSLRTKYNRMIINKADGSEACAKSRKIRWLVANGVH